MGIDVVWQGENGESLGGVTDTGNSFSRSLERVDIRRTVCLRFIDPYGDTIFNQNQISVFAKELEFLKSSIDDPQLCEHLESILALARKSSGQIHTYLKCVGE